MKNIIVYALIISVVISVFSCNEEDFEKIEGNIVFVNADESISFSGITVEKGELLEITASGTWCYDKDNEGCCGPHGQMVAANEYKGKLMAKIGNSGVGFEVGLSCEKIAPVGGELIFYMLDPDNDLSNNYGAVMAQISTSQYDDNSNHQIQEGTVADIDGNLYKTVKIGEQWWMAENLKTTSYNDGTPILLAADDYDWYGTGDAYCWYNNELANEDSYGGLYKLLVATSNKVCPEGWNVPTEQEWTELIEYINQDGFSGKEGLALKSVQGWTNDGNGVDYYGFNAKPGGMRFREGKFSGLSNGGNWWVNKSSNMSRIVVIAASLNEVIIDDSGLSNGFSIRCVTYNEQTNTLPQINTSDVSDITANSAVAGGSIVNSGNSSISDKGVCWSTSMDPTINNYSISSGTGTEEFIITISNLQADTKYYVRAYATNESGTSYGENKEFTTLSGTGDNTVTDIDGNIYNTVQIGDQVWMAENLKTTHYPDGNTIPLVTDNTVWGNLNDNDEAYCYYNNDEYSIYGGLYTYSAANGACPSGWHLPTDDEWTELTLYVANDGYSGQEATALKAVSGWTDWDGNPEGNGTDIYGFSALPGGYRSISSGEFGAAGPNGNWWSSTLYDNRNAYIRAMSYEEFVNRFDNNKATGYSVRCIKD